MKREQMKLTKTMNLLWRAGIAATVFLAVAASSNAQVIPLPTDLGVTVQYPHIHFNGSSLSRVNFTPNSTPGTGGTLTLDAGATLLQLSSADAPFAVDSFYGSTPLVGAACAAGSVYAVDANGQNGLCYDYTSGPATPGIYGAFRIREKVDALGQAISGVGDPCGDLCIQGAVLRNLGPVGPNGLQTWQIVYGGQGVTLLSGKIRTDVGLQPLFADPASRGECPPTTSGACYRNFEFVFQVTGGALASLYPAVSGDPNNRKFVHVIVHASQDPIAAVPTVQFVDWANAFSEVVVGGANSIQATPFLIPDPPADVWTAFVQAPIKADGTAAFKKKSTVPVKFKVSLNNVPTCATQPATISLRNVSSGGTVLDTTIYEIPADDGANYRISDCQYVYNLGTKNLTNGAYEVSINIGLLQVGVGKFTIK